MVPFTMPSLGADMDEGTVVEWRVAPGETVHRGDVVAVVETDKSDLDVEVFLDGVVHDLVVPVGVRVPVGTVLATIEPAASQGPRRSATAAPVPVPVPVP
ncbi:MAG: 2-oxo acid dehydrogenase subunit E2, partial [Actinobacteria bacterium]|nr:2-oxo acid dehydrogenase subunit E2 [Actinomycetota bacterium]